MSNDVQNGWNEWSKHVLKELERLNDGIDGLHSELQSVKTGMQKMAVLEDQTHELKEWKKDISEVCSPTQFKELKQTVDDLKYFKTKAITVFAVIQTIMGIVISILAIA